MAPTAALVTVREPDGRTVYINQERVAELFIRALGDQYQHRVVQGDGITQRLTVIEAALRVQAAAAPADGLGVPPGQLSAVISALRAHQRSQQPCQTRLRGHGTSVRRELRSGRCWHKLRAQQGCRRWWY